MKNNAVKLIEVPKGTFAPDNSFDFFTILYQSPGLGIFFFLTIGAIISYCIKIKSPFGLTVITLSLLSSFASILINFIPDDSFAHFRVIDNLTTYGTYTYNFEYFVEGTATPLWHLILYIFSFLDIETPIIARTIGIFCNMIFLFGISKLIIKINKNLSSYWHSVILSLCAFNPNILLYTASGMETLLYVTIAIYFIKNLLNERLYKAIFFSLLLVLVRFDGVIYIGIIFSIYILIQMLSKSKILNLKIFLWPFILFLFTMMARKFYFGEFIPHVVSMKTSNSVQIFAGINYGLKSVFMNFPIILFLMYFIIKRKNDLKNNINFIIIFFSLLIFTLFVIIGGGDWMPGGRYLILPQILLIICLSWFFPVFLIKKTYKYYLSIFFISWPLLTCFLPSPYIFKGNFVNRSPLIKFVKNLNDDAEYLSSLGNGINVIIPQNIKSSIYTRWIGFIPHHIGVETKVYDELCYFYSWEKNEYELMNKTTKIGHTIEASNLIKIFKPDIITNISSSLGPSPFWRKKISLEQLENISFKIPKNLDDKNKEFIYENYNTCLLFEKQDSLST